MLYFSVQYGAECRLWAVSVLLVLRMLVYTDSPLRALFANSFLCREGQLSPIKSSKLERSACDFSLIDCCIKGEFANIEIENHLYFRQ